MDLEEHARSFVQSGLTPEQIIEKMKELTGSEAAAKAILVEVENTENLPSGFISMLCSFPRTGFFASDSGLGCRGEGDFLIHHTLAELIGPTDAVVDARQQDDGGIIKADHGFISAAVDGMHSRLSHFPFLAGFHAARAAIRDVVVMGARPLAILSDIHIANDGDIGKILDYTAGAGAVSDLLNVPLIGGSTLRIGGDLVTGDRLTGCIVSFGTATNLTARKNAQAGDVLVMMEGTGGGTISTTALYNGQPEVMLETLNVKSIAACMEMLQTPLAEKIHSMTDITNGGIRGDAFEFGSTAEVKVVFNQEKVLELISPKILKMLNELDIDPLGISTDALLFTLKPEDSDELIQFLSKRGLKAQRVGHIEHGSGVQIITDEDKDTRLDLQTRFREAPYTPLKKVVDDSSVDINELKNALKTARKDTLNKKIQVLEWIKAERKN
ncbi:MAG: hypothetical protein JSV49_08215 [Thermoplasmata archaeon]|nr:MAG: hypothetical protein JSV49_08215 [Thermoplasmata archaeon]